MMNTEDIPIPSQIFEILGERNATDIYDEESLGENSDVDLYHTNHRTYRLKPNTRKYTERKSFLNHLKTFQQYYLSKDTKKPRSASQRNKKSTEGESGYGSKDPVSSTRKRQKLTPRKKTEMPRATSPCSPSSQLDIFSTRSPVKVGSVANSTPNKSVVHTRSAVVKTSSSEDESEGEFIPRIKISPSITTHQADTMVTNHDSENTVRKRENSSKENDSNVSDGNKTPDHKQPLNTRSRRADNSEKSLRVKSEDQKDSDSDDSESTSTSLVSAHQASAVSDNGSSGSDESEHEIIPATQDVSQKSKNMFISANQSHSVSDSEDDNLVSDSEGAKLDSLPKLPKRENRSPFRDFGCPPSQADNEIMSKGAQSHSTSKLQAVTPTLRENATLNSSDSEDDKVFPKPSLTNESSTSNISIPLKTESSSSSDSNPNGDECSSKNSKESSPQRMVFKSQPHNKDSENSDGTNKPDIINPSSSQPVEKLSPTILKNVKTYELPNQDSPDSSNMSDSDNSDQEASANAKSSSPYSSDSADDQLRRQTTIRQAEHLSTNLLKRKADSISFSNDNYNEPKQKVRRTIGSSENVPFSSTRNPETDSRETSFPGSDISMIPKVRVGASCLTEYQKNPRSSNSASASQTKGPSLPRPGQLSILEFAKPFDSPSQTSCQNKYEALRQEYCDAGFSSLKEQYDFESYEGLLEEDLLDKDIELYVVQCPKEVDPISLVGQKIDVSKTESVVELAVIGGRAVRHDIYCDLSDSGFGINVIVPSRTKKKFSLNAVPVDGRLTIVESVDVPQIEEFDSSSPPRVEFPKNLRARNTFVESDESTAQSILEKPNKNKSRQATKKEYEELASFISDQYKEPKYEPIVDDETYGEKLKNRSKKKKDSGKLDDRKIHEDGPSVAESLHCLDTENPEVHVKKNKKKKKKKSHEEYQKTGVSMTVEKEEEDLLAYPTDVAVEESTGRKKKKKKRKHELEEPHFDVLDAGEGESSVAKKKKKKKKETEWMKTE